MKPSTKKGVGEVSGFLVALRVQGSPMTTAVMIPIKIQSLFFFRWLAWWIFFFRSWNLWLILQRSIIVCLFQKYSIYSRKIENIWLECQFWGLNLKNFSRKWLKMLEFNQFLISWKTNNFFYWLLNILILVGWLINGNDQS